MAAMTDTVPAAPSPEGWTRLIAARHAYSTAVGRHYDEILDEISERTLTSASIGKADIGALPLWKRMRADTRWAGALMAMPDVKVRQVTGAAVAVVRDTSADRGTAAGNGRRALLDLPGFVKGDALASAVLTAAAPDRMAVYDRHTHRSLHQLGVHLTSAPGRCGRYLALLDRMLAVGPLPSGWTARDLDIALHRLSKAHSQDERPVRGVRGSARPPGTMPGSRARVPAHCADTRLRSPRHRRPGEARRAGHGRAPRSPPPIPPRPAESRNQSIGLYRRTWEHSDATINGRPLDAPGCPWGRYSVAKSDRPTYCVSVYSRTEMIRPSRTVKMPRQTLSYVRPLAAVPLAVHSATT